MKRILLISLQILLWTSLYSVMTQMLTNPKNVTPYINRSWRNTNKDPKILRQGISFKDASPRGVVEEDAPRRDCVCSKIYDPVCASNNESYYNLCFLECKVPKANNVSVIHQGNCIPF